MFASGSLDCRSQKLLIALHVSEEKIPGSSIQLPRVKSVLLHPKKLLKVRATRKPGGEVNVGRQREVAHVATSWEVAQRLLSGLSARR